MPVATPVGWWWSGGLSVGGGLPILAHVHFPKPTGRQSEYVKEWRDALPAGRLIGPSDAKVMIVAFSDLECPYCRNFHGSVRAALERHPFDVAFTFVHFPLPGHEHALGAARTAECAAQFGRFAESLDFMFANQDSLGKRDWTWFARGARVADSSGFANCMAVAETPSMIEAGMAVGATREIRGTPTVFLNGWRFGGTPIDLEFQRAVEDLIAGKKPYDGFPSSAVNAQRD